jgi:hypothetical protein
MGSQLTTKVFARNLVPGDLFVSGTGMVVEVLGIQQGPQLDYGYGPISLTLRTKGTWGHGAGQPMRIPYSINQSVNYILGSRSAGQIN